MIVSPVIERIGWRPPITNPARSKVGWAINEDGAIVEMPWAGEFDGPVRLPHELELIEG